MNKNKFEVILSDEKVIYVYAWCAEIKHRGTLIFRNNNGSMIRAFSKEEWKTMKRIEEKNE